MNMVPYISLYSPSVDHYDRVRETIKAWLPVTNDMILQTQFGRSAQVFRWAREEFPEVIFRGGFKVATPLRFEGAFNDLKSWARVEEESRIVLGELGPGGNGRVLLDCETALEEIYIGTVPKVDSAWCRRLAKLKFPPHLDFYDVQILCDTADFKDREQKTTMLLRAFVRAAKSQSIFFTGFTSSPRLAKDTTQQRLAKLMDVTIGRQRCLPCYALALTNLAWGDTRWTPETFTDAVDVPTAVVWAGADELAEVGRVFVRIKNFLPRGQTGRMPSE